MLEIKLLLKLLITQLFFILLSNSVNCFIDFSCKCVIFNSTYGKDYGIFKSPNWPLPYEDDISCLLYTFQAKNDQIVEITFDEFDVQKANLECVYRDYIKLFLNLPDNVVYENTSHNHLLCGHISDIEQTHYSSHSTLIFEFHTDWRSDNNTGFRGTFRFLNKKLFQTDGKLEEGKTCEYIFDNNILNRQKGNFFSPQYPSTYPKSNKCKYKFIGKTNEYVKIIFEYLSLQKTDSICLFSPDYIQVYDGFNHSSQVIGLLCNVNRFIEFKSTNNTIFIEFITRSLFPGQGFRASYFFEKLDSINQNESNTTNYISINNDNFDSKSFHKTVNNQIRSSNELKPTKENSACNQYLSSDKSKTGNIFSPNYPNPYLPNLHCVYNFTSRGKERVKIKFNDFSIYKPEDTDKDCNGADVLMVYITINGQRIRLDNLCGTELPKQIMSNDNSLVLEFKTFHQSAHTKGFSISYEFTSNFGILSGKQDSQKVCSFIYNSKENQNGIFTSPNYPGFYPRDTECHYYFYAEPNERVQISFTSFKVEGILPCSSDTASDYLEFSNYRTVDRKIPRHCGTKLPEPIESDGDFFRITFKSNDRFDETGFQATYQFKKIKELEVVKKVKEVPHSPSSSCSLLVNNIIFFTILIYFCFNSIRDLFNFYVI